MIKHGPVTVKQDAKAVLPCTLSTSNLGSLEVVRGGWRQLNSVPADAPRLPSLNTNTKEFQWISKDIDKSKVYFPYDNLKTNLSITLLKVSLSSSYGSVWSGYSCLLNIGLHLVHLYLFSVPAPFILYSSFPLTLLTGQD